jgi:hypothetical protein
MTSLQLLQADLPPSEQTLASGIQLAHTGGSTETVSITNTAILILAFAMIKKLMSSGMKVRQDHAWHHVPTWLRREEGCATSRPV